MSLEYKQLAINKILKAYKIIRNNGVGFCAFRAQYELRKKLGLLKRKFPTRRWSKISLVDYLKPQIGGNVEDLLRSQKSMGRRFFFEADTIRGLNSSYKEKILSDADEILQNNFRYFFDKTYSLGNDPDWFLNPVTGKRAKSGKHWCDIDFFDPDTGDIKFIWEPSRFAWVYTLVRAYAVEDDEKYAEKFWELFESWLESNPLNMGPNYACGQECAIRLMAMCFAFYGFDDTAATSLERQSGLAVAIAAHAERIERNIDFAISTRTNHSLTEAAGIYTAGILFPQFKHSGRWVKLGKKILTSEGLKQIYPDGSYIQHSMNYHRLMLQDFLWVLRLGELNYDSFEPELISRVKKATEFLYQMQDDNNGRVPNYGANDGALIMPLNNCDYLDFRPVVQAAHYLLNRKKLLEKGPWDEDMVWFFGREAVTGEYEALERQSSRYDCGGYYTLVSTNSWAMMRCHSYKNRPGHADMLHLDLWWKGHNILRDSGTYMYNCREPWQSFFGSAAAHNTVVVDGSDQMDKLSRFMWSDWTKSKFIAHRNYRQGNIRLMQGEHYAYCHRKNKVIHRRAVLSFAEGIWLIVDDLLGGNNHSFELCWQLFDAELELKDNLLNLHTESGPVSITILDSINAGKCEYFKGDDKPMGWESVYYANRRPAPTLVYSASVNIPFRLITVVGLGDAVKTVILRQQNILSLVLGTTGRERIITLNSIDNSDKNTFIYTQQDAEKTFLD